MGEIITEQDSCYTSCIFNRTIWYLMREIGEVSCQILQLHPKVDEIVPRSCFAAIDEGQ